MYGHEPQPHHHRKTSFWTILLENIALAAAVAVVLLCMQFAAPAQAQIPDFPRAGEIYFTADDGRSYPALQLHTAVFMHIQGMTARVTVKQAFTNDSGAWQEGIYVFPLPDDSAVNALRMKISEREIVGEIHERQEAQEIYRKARETGQKAALIEQQRPNTFTQSVANIAPGETVVVELQYIQAVRYDSGRFNLRFPMTITPRYVPGLPLSAMDEHRKFVISGDGWVQPRAQVPDATEITPPYLPVPAQNTVSFDINLDAGMELDAVRSPSHTLDITQSPQRSNYYHMTLRGGTVGMDHDFELEWLPLPGSEPQAASFMDRVEDDTYLQVMLMPPRVDAIAALRREVVIVLDTSGSMAGSSMAQAKRSVEFALAKLRAGDRFNLVEFNSDFHALFPAAVAASAANVAIARGFVRALDADGGTEMYPALKWALAAGSPPPDELLKQLVFITDGSVGNEEQMLALIKNELGSSRLFTVGIGSAPNSYFMRKAAEFGRGSYIYISDTTEVAARMDELFGKLGSAVMAGVQLHWPAGFDVEFFPGAIPDLYLGEPLFVTARINGQVAQQFEIGMSGELQGRAWDSKLTVTPAGPVSSLTRMTSSIASYWARQKVAALADLLNDGVAMEEVKARILAVALPFRLVSRFSSFVAVEKTIARTEAPLLSGRLGNEPPAGQLLAAQMAGRSPLAQPVSYPATATPAALFLFAGLVVMLLGLISSRRRRHKLRLLSH